MRILTEYKEKNKIKLWEGVKSFDSFKYSLENNRGVQGKIDYYLIGTKENITLGNDYKLEAGRLKILNIELEEYEDSVLKDWTSISEESRPSYFSPSELEDISFIQANWNEVDIKKIRWGDMPRPDNYPLVMPKNVSVTRNRQKTVCTQEIEVRKI